MSIKSKQNLLLFIFLCGSLLEGLLAFLSIALVPSDPKNALIGRFSLSRLILLGCSLILIGTQVVLLIREKKVLEFLERIITVPGFRNILQWIGAIAAIGCWFTIWFPADRLGEFSASYIRIKPLLLCVELWVFQFYIYIKWLMDEIGLKGVGIPYGRIKRTLLIIFVILAAGIGIFELLKFIAPADVADQLIYPPGAPVSAIQVFLAWIFFGILFLLEQKNPGKFEKTGWVIATCLLLMGSAFILWNFAPFTCTDDRPGPFPPNNQCYPTINDAVYSIGSHYITLGQGIYNQWQTDKPLYMMFLALGELIAGPRIDQYLVFQVAVLTLIPAMLFLFGRKFSGYAGGIFLAVLSSLLMFNQIVLYRMAGGVNVKLENTELLTALFLILICFSVFRWWNGSSKFIWAAVSGGLLGAASLLRINPVFIVPVLLFVAIIAGWKRKKSVFLELAVFLISFLLVFSPTIFYSKDQMGKNYYLAKIENVVAERYSENEIPEDDQPALTSTETPSTGTGINNAQNEPAFSGGEITSIKGASLFVYFFDNVYSSAAVLPASLHFIGTKDQVNQPIWGTQPIKLMWNTDLSLENIEALLLNTAIAILGICIAGKKFGWAGLSALVIQIGYLVGNAFAKSAGGRYLQPVIWVNLLYFCIGMAAILSLILRVFRPGSKNYGNSDLQEGSTDARQERFASKANLIRLSGLLVIFLAFGFSVPLMNHLKSQLPDETNRNADQVASAKILDTKMISSQQWQSFLQDPNHLIVQGRAYHPIYYRSEDFLKGNVSFEMMVLGNHHVFVNHLMGVQPETTFTDGSDVILVGCKLGQDKLWSADRILIQSFAVIQLDHEQSVYIDPDAKWSCNK